MYYAEYCHYGIQAKNGRELHRFETMKDRNMWVDNDSYRAGWHRCEISAKSARKKYPAAFAEPDLFDDGEHNEWLRCRYGGVVHEVWPVEYQPVAQEG
jgi:hypothetical protein